MAEIVWLVKARGQDIASLRAGYAMAARRIRH